MKSFAYAVMSTFLLLMFSSALHQDVKLQSVKQYSAEQFLDTISFAGGAFSHDEKRIYYASDATGIFNIYVTDIESGAVKQLTHSTHASYMLIDTLPHDDRFLFSYDGDGNEVGHIWLWETDGTIRDLTPFEGARCEFYGWSTGGDSFFFGCNARDSHYMDIYEIALDTFTAKLIFENMQGLDLGSISPNKRFAAFSKVKNSNSTDIYLYDFDNKTMSQLTHNDEDVVNAPARFSLASDELYFLTDKEYDFQYLKKINLESRVESIVAHYDWDISGFNISRHGRYSTTKINADGRTQLSIFDEIEHKQCELPEFPMGEIIWTRISRSEQSMLFAVNGDRSPANLYVYNFTSKTFKQLTNSLSNSSIDPEDLVEAEIIRFTSYDGKQIPALFYKPHQRHENQKLPALIWMHGGPGGQSTVSYNYLIQYLANHGYAILAVNNRGSSGYGKEFFRAADRAHGEADLGDCISAKEFLAETGFIDRDKIGIAGGSYGGYLTLAALAFHPESMAVGIDIFGVADWIRTLNSIPDWWESNRELLYQKIGHPVHDREYLESISPLFHTDRICKPLLVIQGANDPRVLKVESDQIVEALKERGTPCEYVLFHDEGHGFIKKKNRQTAAEAILDFLHVHLPIEEN